MQDKIELVIFDCDGVVIDSEIISARVLIAHLCLYGVKVDRQYVMKHFLGRSFPTVHQHIEDNFSVQLPDNFEQEYRTKLLAEFQTQLAETPGFSTMLAQLNCQYCIATSSSPKRVQGSLLQIGLAEQFKRNVFTASEVEHGKPAPDLFLHAAKQMGVAADLCMVIEDSQPGVQAGQAANMQVINYRGGGHLINQKTQQADNKITQISCWREFIDMYPQLFTQEFKQ
ncbi:hypothetical protein DS2_16474 [Catenovulum agarivorans DS-2]|uniref:Hydrolase n=1 Tax=Catenovulum agarivorans DS-2 TaxID=1328313 RepID=W7QKN6_9ALTE|nr:HAD family hydrolase [Catenovulum agarivorans]EWH08628.1 hypothetical protein DS2_16474 [Catenovulum agarivorans DS-2]